MPDRLIYGPTTGRGAVLELGVGKKRFFPGSVTVDICAESKPDVLHDLDTYPYPFEDSSFDLVACMHVLEHLADVVRVVEEIHRVLRPGGILLVEVPHFSSVFAYSDPTHKHFFGCRSFDYFIEGTEVSRFDYSGARFRLVRREFVGRGRNPIKRVFKHWINSHQDFYEQHLAFVIPQHTLIFELQAQKGGGCEAGS